MPAVASAAKAVFLTAVEKPTPAERVAYLDQACGGDAELRGLVEAMLRAHDQSDPLLDKPVAAHLSADNDVIPLDFLEPGMKSGSLGRLGHYEVLGVVGRGGMGIVLRAFDDKLHRVVAVKVLAPLLAGNGAARQRFVREARAAAAVTHDHVIGTLAVEDAGAVPYIVMQYIEGKTLQDKLDRDGPLPLAETLRIGLQLAEGLAAAHRQGIVHRDIKPANILLENGIERVKITDFGLARTVDDASLTRSGFVAGTPAYMSPEQAEGQRIDHRSDLFSLGSVLYAMCTGRPPFRADSAMGVLRRVCDETPPPVRGINTAVPEWLEAAIAKLHAKKPEDRFATASEVAALLGRRLAQLQSGHDSSEGFPAEPKGKTDCAARRTLLRAAGLLLLSGVVAVAVWSLAKNPRGSEDSTKNEPPVQPPPTPVLPSVPFTLRPAFQLDKHTDGVRSLAFSPDGKVLASGGLEDFLYLWDTTTWKAPSPLKRGRPGDVSAMAFSSDSRRLASVTSSEDADRIRVWDVATGQPAASLGKPSLGMWDVAYSPNGRFLICGGYDKKLYRVNAENGDEQVLVEQADPGFVRVLSISQDGTRVSAGGNAPPRMWNAATGEPITTQVELPLGMCPLFVPGGLAGWNYGEGRVILCDLPSGKERKFWRSPKGTINGLAVSADGRFLASIGENGEAHVFSSGDLTEVAVLIGHRGPVFSVAFSPDGKRLATGGEQDKTIFIWDLPEVCHVRK